MNCTGCQGLLLPTGPILPAHLSKDGTNLVTGFKPHLHKFTLVTSYLRDGGAPAVICDIALSGAGPHHHGLMELHEVLAHQLGHVVGGDEASPAVQQLALHIAVLVRLAPHEHVVAGVKL